MIESYNKRVSLFLLQIWMYFIIYNLFLIRVVYVLKRSFLFCCIIYQLFFFLLYI